MHLKLNADANRLFSPQTSPMQLVERIYPRMQIKLLLPTRSFSASQGWKI